MHRILTLTIALLALLTAAAPANAAVGALTFSSCVQATASVAAPCTASAVISGPTDVQAGQATLGVTSATGNAFAALAQSALSPVACFGGGTLAGCPVPTPASGSPLPAAAFVGPEGFATVNASTAYIAATTNNDIAELGVAGGADACVAQGSAMGCGAAHGLTHPMRLALARTSPALPPTQLYAATDDGVAWFNIDPVDLHLTYAGCRKPGATDTCGDTSFVNNTSIAVSPDASSVYVGSSNGAVTGYRRAADGSLTQISCVTSSASPPSGCVTGNGLSRVSAVAVSPDGNSVYAIGTFSHAVATFARAADGTISETGCIATTAVGGCTADAQLSSVNGVAVSPDGRNVYVGDTQNEIVTFARAADGTLTAAGCVRPDGAACVGAGFANFAGSVSVTPDGKWVDVASQDFDGVAAFARTRMSADLEVSATVPSISVATVTRDFTVVNHGPDAATGAELRIAFPKPTIAAAATASGGACADQSPDAHSGLLACPLGTLASGATGHVSVTLTDSAAPALIAATADEAVYIDDPLATNNEIDTSLTPCSDGSVTAGSPCPPAPPSSTTTTTPPTTHAAKLVISGAKFSPSTFTVKRTGRAAHRHHVHHVGSHIVFQLSHGAAVRISFALVRKGHRDHPIGTLLDKAAFTTNSVAFSGNLHAKALKPGRYHATLRAQRQGFLDATPRTVSFTVTRN
jgi:hypothetical protein